MAEPAAAPSQAAKRPRVAAAEAEAAPGAPANGAPAAGAAASAPAAAPGAAAGGGGVDRAVYYGEEGSLTHVAATRFFKNFPQTGLYGTVSFDSAFAEVVSGRALYGVIPIENSASGSLHRTYDLLAKHDVVIGGELGVREVYCLCAQRGVSLQAVQRVLSHPNILEACSMFMEVRMPRPSAPESGARGGAGLETLAMRSTTEAVRRVARPDVGDPAEAMAAIATREAARRHGLEVIADDIGNDAFLETRYILIHLPGGNAASRPAPFPRDVMCPLRKRSACFALRNESSMLFKLISCWALRGIDIIKVETRPLAGGRNAPPGLPPGLARLWDYLFYVEWAEPPSHTKEKCDRLWETLAEFSLWQRDFGAYPSQTTRAEKQPQSWDEMVDLMTKS